MNILFGARGVIVPFSNKTPGNPKYRCLKQIAEKLNAAEDIVAFTRPVNKQTQAVLVFESSAFDEDDLLKVVVQPALMHCKISYEVLPEEDAEARMKGYKQQRASANSAGGRPSGDGKQSPRLTLVK